jgi:hypothetical protein
MVSFRVSRMTPLCPLSRENVKCDQYSKIVRPRGSGYCCHTLIPASRAWLINSVWCLQGNFRHGKLMVNIDECVKTHHPSLRVVRISFHPCQDEYVKVRCCSFSCVLGGCVQNQEAKTVCSCPNPSSSCCFWLVIQGRRDNGDSQVMVASSVL